MEIAETSGPILEGADIAASILEYEGQVGAHRSGSYTAEAFSAIAARLPRAIQRSAETGCGSTTVLFSRLSSSHTVFCLDDTDEDHSSLSFYRECPLTNRHSVSEVLGPTQKTLPIFQAYGQYDVVLIDGPHGWPFPELEYFYFYPHIRPGGLLIVDDCGIPTISRMVDILAEDEMWELDGFVADTAFLRRTDATTFKDDEDGWWLQRYNVSRCKARKVSPPRDQVSSRDWAFPIL